MLSLVARRRKEIGKKLKTLRNEGFLPGIVYGKEIGNLPIIVKYQDFKDVLKKISEGTIINLKIEKKNYPVLIREIQKDSLSEKFLHVDFYQLPMDKEVEVNIPLVFEGVAPAEKELGGVLIKNLHEVKIRALPKNLISSIKVDISSLSSLESEIKIKDLKLPPEIKILENSEEIVALVKKEEEKIEVAPEQIRPEEIKTVKEEKEKSEE